MIGIRNDYRNGMGIEVSNLIIFSIYLVEKSTKKYPPFPIEQIGTRGAVN